MAKILPCSLPEGGLCKFSIAIFSRKLIILVLDIETSYVRSLRNVSQDHL